jgi:hypothetical protein
MAAFQLSTEGQVTAYANWKLARASAVQIVTGAA